MWLVLCLLALSSGDGETRIASDEAWYRERSEPERSWTGVLEKRPIDQGPNARSALAFTLVAGRERFPVYSPAPIAAKLAPFEGKKLVVRGKLIDLSSESFGKEVWIGTVVPGR